MSAASVHDPDALWHIAHDRCVPSAGAGHGPQPCARVDPDGGYVLLKDLVGSLQYLLIPTARVTGIESPAVLAPDTPHYFAEAWHNRCIMARRFGHAIPDNGVLLALNSRHGRTQNQLHIHISCIDPQVKTQLTHMARRIDTRWAALPKPPHGHRYIGRRVSLNTLESESATRLLAGHDDRRPAYGRLQRGPHLDRRCRAGAACDAYAPPARQFRIGRRTGIACL
ncbi:MAG: CDP-diacylglycerol diphosphatase [Salinisphaera sp.]